MIPLVQGPLPFRDQVALEQYQVTGPQQMAVPIFDSFSLKNLPKFMTNLTTFRGVTWISDRNVCVGNG